MLHRFLLLFVLLIFFHTVSTAQLLYNKNELGIQGGAVFYQGDLTANTASSFKVPNFSGELYYSRLFNNYLFGRFNVMLGSLHGDDALNQEPGMTFMQQRLFRFRTPLLEASLLAGFNLFGDNYNDKPLRFSPYLMAGFGAAYVNVNRDWSRTDTSLIHAGSALSEGLVIDSVQSTSRTFGVFPVAVGAKYALTQRLAVTAEAKYRFTTSDYLDGFSYAANPNRNDAYFSIMLGLAYNFGKGAGFGKKASGIGCPKF